MQENSFRDFINLLFLVTVKSYLYSNLCDVHLYNGCV